MKMKAIAVIGGCVAGMAFASSANADSVHFMTVTYHSDNPAEWVHRNYEDAVDWDAPMRSGGPGGYAGQMKFTNGMHAFCFELNGTIQSGDTVTYKLGDLDSYGARANVLRQHYSANYRTLQSSYDYAAFQMISWEIMSENWDATDLGQLQMHMGAVQFNEITALESTIDVQISRISNGGLFQNLEVWTSSEYQDIIVVVPGPSIALAGMIGLAVIRRRRRN